MSLTTFIAAEKPHQDALDAYTDQLHARYGGQAGTDMDDDTWAATTPEEVAEYRRLERLADAEHESLKAQHRD